MLQVALIQTGIGLVLCSYYCWERCFIGHVDARFNTVGYCCIYAFSRCIYNRLGIGMSRESCYNHGVSSSFNTTLFYHTTISNMWDRPPMLNDDGHLTSRQASLVSLRLLDSNTRVATWNLSYFLWLSFLVHNDKYPLLRIREGSSVSRNGTNRH